MEEQTDYYQPLFNKLSEHGLILLESEMDEIIDIVRKINRGDVYSELAKINGLVESTTPNIWLEIEPRGDDEICKSVFILTKYGFQVKHTYIKPKPKSILSIFFETK